MEHEIVLDTIAVSATIDNVNIRREVYSTLPVKIPNTNSKFSIRLKLDTGASGNTIPMRTMRQIYDNDTQIKELLTVEPVKLTAYNGKNITYIGSITLPLNHNDKWYDTKFYVIDVPNCDYKVPPVLGLQSLEDMNIITVHTSDAIASAPVPKVEFKSVDDLKKAYPKQFDTIGNFKGSVSLQLKEDAKPFVAAPRKCPINLKDKIKDELDDMESKGIIRKVDEPTDWVSSVCFVTKKDGSLRVCLDPKHLNDALKRTPHKIPTVEELNPQFSGAKYFSKLDAKAGYWSVKLDEDSQLYTTFRSPLGQRYCFLRLPFGLSTSQDDFQKKMDDIIEDLPGVVSIADDVCVVGSTIEEHDTNLVRLMDRAVEGGLVFNSSKCDIRQTSITFFGNVYTADGVKPDPKKVEDIRNMPIPQNKDDLRRVLGLITYVSQFIPNFSDKSAILRELLKDGTIWCWEECHQEAYDTLKNSISDQSALMFFDTSKTVTLEVDASLRGLGAALIQDGKPVMYASKALTDTQSRYSNIEREMLAVVFGCERFHHLVYGKEFKVITDHKPLITICKKSILAAPARLQRMLLRVQGYDMDISYRPGSQMILADALSRMPNSDTKGSVDLDIRIDMIDIELTSEELRNIGMINVTDKRKSVLLKETAKDHVLNALKDVIFTGWPKTIKELPNDLRPYWPYRDELAVESGIIFKGKQIVIPDTQRSEILMQLHQSHQGIEKTRALSRESCYWPNISRDIEKICRDCPLCQEYQHENRREPIQAYEAPSKKWQYIGTDLFEINGRQFLLICDKFTKFPIVEEIIAPVTSKVISDKFRLYCAMFGIPQVIYSDNGSQFAGEPFRKFCSDWAIMHITSSPHHSQSNGFIERQVGHLKPLIRKSLQNGQDMFLTLLNIRATPISSKLASPAELLLGEPIATTLPSHSNIGREEDIVEIQRRRDQMIKHDSETSLKTPLPPLYPGQNVRVLSSKNHRWFPGVVIERDSTPRSYKIRSNNRIIRRNRAHIRPIPKSPNTPVPGDVKDSNIHDTPKNCGEKCEIKPSPQKSPIAMPTPVVPSVQCKMNNSVPQFASNSPKMNTHADDCKPKTTRSGRTVKQNPKYA